MSHPQLVYFVDDFDYKLGFAVQEYTGTERTDVQKVSYVVPPVGLSSFGMSEGNV